MAGDDRTGLEFSGPRAMDNRGASAPTALIVGAGIGGLAAAVALGRAGWQVRVFERAASPRELGFALMLAPNAIAALRELGLADAVVREGVLITRTEIRRTDGQVLRKLSAAATPGGAAAAPVIALRAVLHGHLLNAVGGDVLRLGNPATDFELTPGAIVLKLADGGTARGDVLIGADGVGSVVRQRLHPNEPAPRPSGFFAIRGVVEGVAGHLGDLSAVLYLGGGIEAATVRASSTAVYWYVSLLAADVPAGRREPRDVLDRCTAAMDSRFRAIACATKRDDLRLDELFARDPLEHWGAGPVTLLGDAAHPMLPHTGQGAAQALEDAVALGLALREAIDPPAALRRYELIRSARTRRIVKLGPRIARITTTRSTVVNALRNLTIRYAPAAAIAGKINAGRGDPHRQLR